MRFAYADPPYLGCGQKHYGRQHDAAADYDRIEAHAALIEQLVAEFPDGWALSLHTPSLRHILPLCPEDVRIGAWVKPFHVFKKGVRPAYAWEPVIFRGGRNQNHPPPPKGGEATTPRDWVSANILRPRRVGGANQGGNVSEMDDAAAVGEERMRCPKCGSGVECILCSWVAPAAPPAPDAGSEDTARLDEIRKAKMDGYNEALDDVRAMFQGLIKRREAGGYLKRSEP